MLYLLGKGATSEAGKCLFIAVNVWWRCVYGACLLLFLL